MSPGTGSSGIIRPGNASARVVLTAGYDDRQRVAVAVVAQRKHRMNKARRIFKQKIDDHKTACGCYF